MLDITHRQEKWSDLKSLIPSPDVVPELQVNTLETITDSAVRKHLKKWVDGQRSLVDIAEGLNQDPLKVAKSYFQWIQAGWVVKGHTATTKISLPTILSVDDSIMMQELIKLALDGYYQVIVASNAVDALNLIYQNKISLLLLDVSMPEIGGLELCRTVRGISQFRDLPIIIVTAQDSFFDKVKGRLAGCTEYLTKPFDAEKLLQVVEKYVKVEVAAHAKSISDK
jgi:twitching motility two-component system response regulator PilG